MTRRWAATSPPRMAQSPVDGGTLLTLNTVSPGLADVPAVAAIGGPYLQNSYIASASIKSNIASALFAALLNHGISFFISEAY